MVRMSNDTVAPSQTLDRGLACLDFVAASDRPVSVDATAEALGSASLDRVPVAAHARGRRLIERNADGDFWPGRTWPCSAVRCDASLRAAAAPVLANLAEDLQMTAFLVVADGTRPSRSTASNRPR